MAKLKQSRGLKLVLATVVVGGVGIGFAVAGIASAETQPAAGTIVCPSVADKLPVVPAQSQAEVERNLALLDTQIAEANQRLVDTVGQGGPNFVDNAILGPLRSKRVATIDRIAISIGRHAERPQGLESLAACTLSTAGGGAGQATTAAPATATAEPSSAGSVPGGAAAVGAISCPSVADKLPVVPAQSQAEVERNLALLDTQIAEANQRLVDTVGQGGPNFVDNAILGPLRSKRVATIDRIAISIGRHAERPQGLESLAACTLVK